MNLFALKKEKKILDISIFHAQVWECRAAINRQEIRNIQEEDDQVLSDIQGVQEKLCIFTIHCNPFLAYIAVRDLQSSRRNASVQSLLLAGHFCTNNSSRVLARERWQTFENSWKKNTIFDEHPVHKQKHDKQPFVCKHCSILLGASDMYTCLLFRCG